MTTIYPLAICQLISDISFYFIASIHGMADETNEWINYLSISHWLFEQGFDGVNQLPVRSEHALTRNGFGSSDFWLQSIWIDFWIIAKFGWWHGFLARNWTLMLPNIHVIPTQMYSEASFFIWSPRIFSSEVEIESRFYVKK